MTSSNVVTGELLEVLSASKTAVPDTYGAGDVVTENGQLTYTFIIQNSGNTPAVATDNLVVRDTFDPILDPITVTLDGETLTEGVDYTYNPATGEFATTESRITVPAAQFAQDPVTGIVTAVPGVAVLRITGTV